MKSVLFSPAKLSEGCMDTGEVHSHQKPLAERNENELKSDSQIPAAIRNYKTPQAPAFLVFESLQIRISLRAEFSGVKLLRILQSMREMGRHFSLEPVTGSRQQGSSSGIHPDYVNQSIQKKGKNVTLSSRGRTAGLGNAARRRPRGAPQKDPAPLTFPSLQERSLSVAISTPPCPR